MYLTRLTSGKQGKKSIITKNVTDIEKRIKKCAIEKNNYLPTNINKSAIEAILNDSEISGDICLDSKCLKDFPKFYNMQNLIDTISCDLSRNQLKEFPKEICIFLVLEKLILYSNNIKSIPDSVCNLKSLRYLDLNSNSLLFLPSSICTLKSMEVLNVSNNKLVSLPEEIGELEKLIQLDASCNEISHLPVQIGELKLLRCLNVRKNLLVELPKEISKCKLVSFNCSDNKVSKLPLCFKDIITLIDLNVENNPLELPPASICTKGLLHIMKYLLNECVKEQKKNGILSVNEMNLQQKDMIESRIIQNSNKIDLDFISKSYKNKSNDSSNLIKTKNSFLFLSNFEVSKENEKDLSRKIKDDKIILIDNPRNDLHTIQKLSKKELSRFPNNYNNQNNASSDISTDGIYNLESNINRLNEYNIEDKIFDENCEKDSTYMGNNYFSKINLEHSNLKITDEINYSEYVSKNSFGEFINHMNPKTTFANNLFKTPNADRTISFVDHLSNDINIKNNTTYTIRRNTSNAYEEHNQILILKECIESKLKINLPDDLGIALADGVVLCHLMNQLFPRTIPIIHVPSMAVPKLSIAKSRKNVESFIEACKKFGLSSNEICCPQDIIESKNTHKVAQTIMMIFKYNEEINYQNRPDCYFSKQQQTAV